jgi:hypothetical protein
MLNEIDHVTVGAADLERGADHMRRLLGIDMPMGGKHADMSTHNRVMRTTDGEFLEMIAIDPEAPAPGRPRWFGLDLPARRARLAQGPAPVGWVIRTDDLDGVVAKSPVDLGPVKAMSRGTRSWRLTVPDDGVGALGGIVPGFIQWDGPPHPSAGMQPSGLVLEAVIVRHPDPAAVAEFLAAVGIAPLAAVEEAAVPGLAFVLRRPDGTRRVLA